jgi:hypothetical protein
LLYLLALTVSTRGRPRLGPSSRRTRIAASRASASPCSSPAAHVSQAGWNATSHDARAMR